MEFKIRLFIAVIFWTSLNIVSCFNPSDICPRRIGDTWRVDEKDGEYRCILSCSDGYVPSGCHVIRPLPGGVYNKPTPVCEKASYVSVKTVAAVGVSVGAVLAAPFVLPAIGFGSLGVVAGSVAASIQGPATVAGSWFAICQSAGVVGIALSTKAAIGGTAYTTVYTTGYVMSKFKRCEAE